jgi:hypothetical protein
VGALRDREKEIFWFDREKYIGYNMLNKGAGR